MRYVWSIVGVQQDSNSDMDLSSKTHSDTTGGR